MRYSQASLPTCRALARLGHGGAAAVLAAALVACGSSQDATEASPETNQTNPAQDDAEQPADEFGFNGAGSGSPGVSGLVADISEQTAQVQSTDRQVAVTYTDETVITEIVSGSADDVWVGACVVVQSSDNAAGSGDDAGEVITAASVSVSEPDVDGECTGSTGGFDGGPGARDFPDDLPTGSPTDGPQAELTPPAGATPPGDGGFPGGGFIGGATGVVTAVDGDSFTVEASQPVPGGQDDEADTTTTTEITTTSTTTWTVQVKAGPEAIDIGTCVSAQGDTDDTGAMTATSIAVQPAENGECVNPGFGSGRGFGNGGDDA